MAKITLKRKIKLKVPEKDKSNSDSQRPSGFQATGFKEFTDALRMSHERNFMGIIGDLYEKTFGVFPPWTEHPIELVRVKLTYELLKRDYEKAGTPMPPPVEQNWEASRDFNINGMTEGMQKLVRSSIRHDEEKGIRPSALPLKTKEPEMIATKSKSVKAAGTAKEKVWESFVRLFRENVTKKLTDAQLAAEMQKAQPGKKKYTAEYMHYVRNIYNRGAGPFEGSKPSTPAVCYDVKETNGKAHAKTAPAPKNRVKAVVAKKRVVLKKKVAA